LNRREIQMNKGLHFRWYLLCCWLSVASGAFLSIVLMPLNLLGKLGGFSFRPMTKAEYAIRFLFPNSYQYHFVLGLAQSEANANLGSNIAKLYNNIFGYGFSPRSPYQSSTYDSKVKNEPIFAVYKNVFYSVYDFFYMSKTYNKSRFEAIQKAPDVEWAANSPYNIGYIDGVTIVFKRTGYFGVSQIAKRNLIYQLQLKHATNEDFAFKITNFISILIAVGVFFISFRWVLPSLRPSKKADSK